MLKRISSIALLTMLVGTASATSLCELGPITFKQGNGDNITFFTGTYALGQTLAAHTGFNQKTVYYPYDCDTSGYQSATVYAIILTGPDRGTYQTIVPQDLAHSSGSNKLQLTFATSSEVVSDFEKVSK